MPLQDQEDRPKIAYLTVNDPADRRSWSGTHYYIAQALERNCGEVIPLGPIKPASMFFRKVLRKALHVTTGKTYLFTHTESFAKETSRIVEKRLADTPFDLIFAPAGSAQVAYLNTEIPIVYLSDATVAAIMNYYPEFSGISERVVAQANRIEQRAIDKAKILIYSSAWAADSARRDYHADPAKVNVVPFGANIDQAPSAARLADRQASESCTLLFVAVDWLKKGGDIAFETLLELERLGIPARLNVVGCTPPEHVTHRNLRVFSFLSKNNVEERAKLESLYLNADFFLLPTRADCSPIVLCEAAAFGLPVISTDTGGVSDIVRNGENGVLLPPTAKGSEYARVIADSYRDTQRFQRMRRRSRELYDTRLNWDAWGKTVAGLIGKPKSFSKAAGH